MYIKGNEDVRLRTLIKELGFWDGFVAWVLL